MRRPVRSGDLAPVDLVVAALSGVLALVGLAAAPALAAADPTADLTLPDAGTRGWWLGAATLLTQAGVLLLRRTAPRAVLLAVAVGVPVAAACGLGDATGLATLPVLVAALTLGLAQPAGRSWPVLVAAAVVVTLGITLAGLDAGESTAAAIGAGVLQGVGTVGLALVVAVVLTARRETRLARESQAAALAREQDALLAAAVARERTAMARELHDIAAHHLSGIAVMTAAIGTQIDTDPAAAKQGVEQVRRQSKAVLRDLRSLVGLLREQDRGEGPDGRPATVRPESLAGVAALVDDAVAAGRDVHLRVLPGGHALGAGVGPLAQLAAYRMAQESLANAARHAPGARTEVELDDRDPAASVVTVRNAPPDGVRSDPSPGTSSGFGLLGMAERAELTGAALEHGPTPEGGWQVRLRMPREALPEDEPAEDDTDESEDR